MTLMALILHVFFDLWMGWVVLRLCPGDRHRVETGVAAFFVGFCLETLLVSCGLMLRVPLGFSMGLPFIVALAGTLVVRCGAAHGRHEVEGAFVWPRFNVYEVLLMLSILAKVGFGIWVIMGTPVFFVDAAALWEERGRCLFGGVNWSLDPASPVFLGMTAGRHYPLALPVWKAVTACGAGAWSDAVARADGIIFYVGIVMTVWLAVWRFSRLRWLAAVAAYVAATLPLQVIHMSAGYADLAVEAFSVAAMAALLRRDWLVAGILVAGSAWIKHDGWVVAILPLGFMALVLPWPGREAGLAGGLRAGVKKVVVFGAGLVVLVPWFLFKQIHPLGGMPVGDGISLHAEGFRAMWMLVINGPTHGLFWLVVIAVILAASSRFWRAGVEGRAILGAFGLTMGLLMGLYGCTHVYRFAVNEMTIHRSLLQCYGTAILSAAYGVYLLRE